MEQYLIQLPKKIAVEIRKQIASSDKNDKKTKIDMISGADNKHFTFVFGGKEIPTKIVQLPTILETHKTYDDNVFYKSGEIGQCFIVAEKEDEKEQLEAIEEVPNGITPPNTNVIKRKYEKTKHNTPYPKSDVVRVEEDLVKMIQGGPFEDVQEELVDFCEWMVDESHPNGIVITDELELIKRHPEYLDLSEEPSEKKRKGNTRANEAMSAINTPIVTDVGSDADAESHVGRDSAQRSPVLAPTPSPTISNDMEDKNVQDLEDDLLDDLEETKEEETQKKPSYHTDPGYLKYVENRGRLQKSLRDEERNVSDLTTKVNTNSNIVVKNRFKLMLESAESKRDNIAKELEQTNAEIQKFEKGEL